MSLATRCPACSTVFRVVQDQLRVSEGWVRCGHCQEVFNALETLFDLAPDASEGAAPHVPATFTDLNAAPVDAPPDPEAAVAPATAADEWTPPPVPPAGDAREALTQAGPDPGTAAEPPAPSPAEDIGLSSPMGPSPEWSRRRRRRSSAGAAATSPDGRGDKPRRRRRQPRFVREAERAAFWRRPVVRAGLLAVAGTLALLLVSQIGYQYRDDLASRVPSLRPALQAGCERLGCRLAAPMALERVRLDSSDLTRTDRDQVLRFTAELRNTADHVVRRPALDVSFTDNLGQVLARKVMLPSELVAGTDGMEPESTWHVDARLAVGSLQIAGYTVEVFYP